MTDQFYLQDSRQIVGNDMMFWAKDGTGYTSDLRRAAVYTREQAQAMHNSRETDIPWPVAYIDARTRPACDVQHVNSDEALEGSGIALAKPKKPRKRQFRCVGCGVFMSEKAFWSGDCSNCGEDSRP